MFLMPELLSGFYGLTGDKDVDSSLQSIGCIFFPSFRARFFHFDSNLYLLQSFFIVFNRCNYLLLHFMFPFANALNIFKILIPYVTAKTVIIPVFGKMCF